ncbi:MAG: alpha-hydroxy acid oxidase [Chloroflexi bacterium]|nr:alpha-hydroxy acid oxidase [Chloroflexota bacterium]
MAGEPINLFDFEALAEQKMIKSEWDYVAGAATDEITLRRTRSAYDHIALRPRVLTGTASVDMSTTVLGHKIAVPFMTSPAGGHKKGHPDGELATARAAAKFGTFMSMSANGSYTLEEVAEAIDGPRFYQCYFYRDRETMASMVKRAEAAGYNALIVTLDSSWPSKRERNIRNGYGRQNRPRPNYTPEQIKLAQEKAAKSKFDSGLSNRGQNDPGATWEDLKWLREITDMPIVFKGIMTGEDAALCAQYGVDGLIVSNHGTRNLDTTLSTIETLSEVVEAAGNKVEVLLDGGIRRGADIVKALALGAKAVMFGRPIFWGLNYDGEDGLTGVMEILRDELEINMVLCGRPTIASIDSTLIRKMPVLD